jgi:hypothetical protein
MTWGGTKKFFREIVTLETGDMPQKVFFGAFWTHCMKAGGGGTLSKKNFENYMFKPAMGSCIKVPTEKKKFLRLLIRVQISVTNAFFLPKNVLFSVFGIRKIINSLPRRRKIAKPLCIINF